MSGWPLVDNPDSEGQAGTIYTSDAAYPPGAVLVEMETQLVTIGADGTEWLDDIAPGWRDHVTIRTYRSRHVMLPEVVGYAPVDNGMNTALKSLMAGLAHKLAADIIQAVEPIVRRYTAEGIGS